MVRRRAEPPRILLSAGENGKGEKGWRYLLFMGKDHPPSGKRKSVKDFQKEEVLLNRKERKKKGEGDVSEESQRKGSETERDGP